MIEVQVRLPPILEPHEIKHYNTTRSGRVYADEAYKDNTVYIIDKDFMKQRYILGETRDFDANRYMIQQNYDRGEITIQRLAGLLESSGLGITEGPTIETFGPEGRQGTTFMYSWTWAKEFGRICGICKHQKNGIWHHAFNRLRRQPLVIASWAARNEVVSWNNNYHHFSAIFLRGFYNIQAINAIFDEHQRYRQGKITKADCLFPLWEEVANLHTH